MATALPHGLPSHPSHLVGPQPRIMTGACGRPGPKVPTLTFLTHLRGPRDPDPQAPVPNPSPGSRVARRADERRRRRLTQAVTLLALTGAALVLYAAVAAYLS